MPSTRSSEFSWGSYLLWTLGSYEEYNLTCFSVYLASTSKHLWKTELKDKLFVVRKVLKFTHTRIFIKFMENAYCRFKKLCTQRNLSFNSVFPHFCFQVPSYFGFLFRECSFWAIADLSGEGWHACPLRVPSLVVLYPGMPQPCAASSIPVVGIAVSRVPICAVGESDPPGGAWMLRKQETLRWWSQCCARLDKYSLKNESKMMPSGDAEPWVRCGEGYWWRSPWPKMSCTVLFFSF